MNLTTLIKKGLFLAVSISLAFSFGLSSGTMAQCAIGAVEAMPSPCNELGFFDVFLDFEYENTGTDGFSVKGNGITYGTFEYSDLPLVIYGLEGDGITFYEFEARDIQFPDCSNFAELGIIECIGGPCHIWDLVIDDHPCVAGMFNVLIDFEYENVSDSGFALYVNYDLYGTYAYTDLPLESIGPFAGDGTTVYHFYVVDLEYEDCLEDANFGPIDCGAGDCNIWDLVVDDHPCVAGMFNVLIDFEYENVSDSGFALYVNYDLYGTYAYADLPLESIGPFMGDGTTVYHFWVHDLMYEECAEDANFGPIDCLSNCIIGDLEPIILPCNENDEFYVMLDFEYLNTSDEFTVQGNGVLYGTYMYADLPVEIGPLLGDGVTVYEFAVIDAVYTDCAEDTYINPVNCDSITEFLNFTTQVVSCENEMYELQMDFDAVNVGSQGFWIIEKDEFYGTFEYDQLPVTIGPLPTDGITSYYFTARDKESPVYGNWNKLIPFTCESLGVSEPWSGDIINVYPNPSYGSVIFENFSERPVSVYLYNSNGAEVALFNMTNAYQINELEAGMYYYQILSEENVVIRGKLVVTR